MSSTGYFVRGKYEELAGIAVRYAGRAGFIFHAAYAAYDHLDGRMFATLEATRRAALDLWPANDAELRAEDFEDCCA